MAEQQVWILLTTHLLLPLKCRKGTDSSVSHWSCTRKMNKSITQVSQSPNSTHSRWLTRWIRWLTTELKNKQTPPTIRFPITHLKGTSMAKDWISRCRPKEQGRFYWIELDEVCVRCVWEPSRRSCGRWDYKNGIDHSQYGHIRLRCLFTH